MAEDSQRPKEIRFVYEKARHHRTLHADGAWAAVTPHAEIQASFFTNLRRMPVSVTHGVGEDDTLGPAMQEEASDLIREVDVTVVMNIVTAKSVIDLLSRMISQAEPILAAKNAQIAADETPKVDTHG
jgi:hypothetical protein